MSTIQELLTKKVNSKEFELLLTRYRETKKEAELSYNHLMKYKDNEAIKFGFKDINDLDKNADEEVFEKFYESLYNSIDFEVCSVMARNLRKYIYAIYEDIAPIVNLPDIKEISVAKIQQFVTEFVDRLQTIPTFE